MNDPVGGEATTAARLLRAAAHLFRVKGYAGTSTRELSDELGIQKASLYHHISNKEDLLYQISIESLAAIHRRVADARDAATPQERLRAMIVAHVETALTDRDLHATTLTELRSLSDERRRQVLKARDEYESMLADALAAAQREGRVRADVPIGLLTLGLLNLLNWSIFWYDPEGPQTAAQIGEAFATLFLEGAQPRT